MGYIVMYCPNCRTTMARMYIHIARYGFRALNYWWCPKCEEHYILQKVASHAITA